MVGVTGFEPATSWSHHRDSGWAWASQVENWEAQGKPFKKGLEVRYTNFLWKRSEKAIMIFIDWNLFQVKKNQSRLKRTSDSHPKI